MATARRPRGDWPPSSRVPGCGRRHHRDATVSAGGRRLARVQVDTAEEHILVHTIHHRAGRLQHAEGLAVRPIFKALTSKGLRLPEHTSEVGSNLASDKHYDRIAFFPDETQDDFTGNHGRHYV